MSIDIRDPDPLYRQIIRDIRRKISSGELAYGERLGSHRILADYYGVSMITVKRALAELIREEVLFARAGKGTFVAPPTTAADLRRHRTIGLVLRDLEIPFFRGVLGSVEEYCYQAGFPVLFSSTAGIVDKEAEQIDRFREIGVSGLIIASVDVEHRATERIRILHAEKFPYVMVSYVEDQDIHYVGVDHEQGAYLSTVHLIQQGYRQIAYLGTRMNDRLSLLREEGYRRALRTNNREVDPDLILRLLDGIGWERYRSAYRIGNRLIASNKLPDAFFAFNDIAALGVEKALLEHDIRIPEDVGLVGFDDVDQLACAAVPLSTIRQPAHEIGREAVQLLLNLISGVPTETRKVLKPQLIVRASSTLRKREFVTDL